MSSLQSLQPIPEANFETCSWYAVHTRSRHEKKVASELNDRGITTFLPLVTELRSWSDRKMKVEVPLFSCYLFVSIPAWAERKVEVLRTSGVLGFVGGNHQTCSVPAQQIEDIQAVLTRKIPCSVHPFVQIGQRVRVRGGALDGVEGVLSRFGGGDRLVISVETIQRSVSITVEGYQVEPVPAWRN